MVTGAHSFTDDHVGGVDSTPPDQLFGHCVEPLVSGLFKGYNATGMHRRLAHISMHLTILVMQHTTASNVARADIMFLHARFVACHNSV